MARLHHLTERGLGTQQHLRDVLMELILAKGWDAVTVKDITERAGIDRTTFYLHFKDKRALFVQVQREFIDQLLSPPSSERSLRRALEGIFRAVGKEAPLYRVLLSTHDDAIEAELHRYIVGQIQQRLAAQGMMAQLDATSQDLVANFIAYTVRGMVQWWLRQASPEPPRHMAQKLQALLLGGISAMHMPAVPGNNKRSAYDESAKR